MALLHATNSATDEEIRKLVLARLSVLSASTALSIGSQGSFTRDEIISHVKAGDAIGETFEKIELEWLRSFKEGIVADLT